jgi:glycyl-tRNA synthetase
MQDLENKRWHIPYVIEPSAGVDRGVLAIMNEAYKVETLENGSERTVMSFKPHLAPIKVAILPLKRNHEGIVNKAKEIKKDLMTLGLGRIFYEDTGNIGKGYRRHDEVGTPLCVTVDFQTVEEDDTVTIRNRDTMAQERIAVAELPAYVAAFMHG